MDKVTMTARELLARNAAIEAERARRAAEKKAVQEAPIQQEPEEVITKIIDAVELVEEVTESDLEDAETATDEEDRGEGEKEFYSRKKKKKYGQKPANREYMVVENIQ